MHKKIHVLIVCTLVIIINTVTYGVPVENVKKVDRESSAIVTENEVTISKTDLDILKDLRLKCSEDSFENIESLKDAVSKTKNIEENLIKLMNLNKAEINQKILRYYFYTNVLKNKILKYRIETFNKKIKNLAIKNNVHVLIFNKDKTQILLQKRGPYKRLFPETETISCCGHKETQSDKSMNDIALDAISNETNIKQPEHNRLFVIGSTNSFLYGKNFNALDEGENFELRNFYETHKKQFNDKNGIIINYSEKKNSLFCYCLRDSKALKITLNNLIKTIEKITRIPSTELVIDNNFNSLYAYILNEEEEYGVRHESDKNNFIIGSVLNEKILKSLDTDTKTWYKWKDILTLFEENSTNFAMDSIFPYFSNKEIIYKINEFLKPLFLNDTDSRANDVSAVGGKAYNLYHLNELKLIQNSVHIPKSFFITTEAYKEIVLKNEVIFSDIQTLNKISKQLISGFFPEKKEYFIDEIKRLSEKIRKNICALDMPRHEKFNMQILEYFLKEAGGDIAVRSSATIEDLKQISAAGQGSSLLHVNSKERLWDSIKEVWSSLFNEGFVTLRNNKNIPHDNAFMGIVLMQMIDATSSGIIFSHDTTSAFPRPVFSVDATFGFGESTVSGLGRADHWAVSPDANFILEKKIVAKTGEYIENSAKEYGIFYKEYAVPENKPSLNDGQVLELANIAKKTLKFYKDNSRVNDDSNVHAIGVDIEFAINKQKQIYIVQARLDTIISCKNGEKYSIQKIDETKLNDDAIKIVCNYSAPLS